MNAEKLSIREKVGFSLGDAAANFIFQAMMMYQMNFYTEAFGLTASLAGVLFLVGRLYGAVADPIMGGIADRTETRWGKFRPWILWTAVPFGIIGFLSFTTPNFAHSGKVIYAFVTYILLMSVYSMNNVPYSALSGVITGDQKQRSSLFSFRFIFVVLATLSIQGFVLPMVNHFGNGDKAHGWQITMGIFSALAVLFFICTFSWTKERIKPNPEQKQSLKQDIKDLLGNQPWVIMFGVFVLMFIFLGIRNSVLIYYFQNYLNPESMATFMDKLNAGMGGIFSSIFSSDKANVADSLYSVVNIISQLATILGIVVSSFLAVKYGKRNIFIFGLILSMICATSFIFITPDAIMMTLVLQILYNFCWGITMQLPWAMMADVADYGDWKYNRRSTAIVFAGIVIGLKVGLALGGALCGFLLDGYGYVANAVQSDTAIYGIRLTTSIFPSVALLLLIILLFFYKIDQKMEIQMQDELAERRKSYKG
jgi:glycoside/pentoside/hexuronide:cation symporter, GPH family